MTPREEAIARLRAALDRDSTCAWAIAPESVAHLLAAYDEAVANTSLPGYERLVAERDAAQERVDLDIDEFRRIKAEIDNLRCGFPPLTEDSARTLYAVVAGICERAVAAGRQRVPLIVQRDKAEAERDTAKDLLAETERERDRARADLVAANRVVVWARALTNDPNACVEDLSAAVHELDAAERKPAGGAS